MKRTTLGTAAMIIAIAAAVCFEAGCRAGTKPEKSAQMQPVHALPSLEKSAVLPTGMTITPMAAPGAAYVALNPGLPDFPDYVAGQPQTTAMSPDGKTLLVLTSGYNRMDDVSGRRAKRDSNEYVFVFDISQDKPEKTQTLQVPNTFNAIAWNPNGNEFYVSGGVDDDVHVFAKQNGKWAESGPPIKLGHKKGLGIDEKPMAAGVAVTADGKKLLVANFENDSMSVIDLATRTKTAELDLRPGGGVAGGEFPFWIVTKGNDEAYVSSPRDRQIVVVNIAGEPKVTGRIRVPGEPTKMILDRAQKWLYAALTTDDAVATINTGENVLTGAIGTTAPRPIFSNPRGLMGSNPNSLALSPDEKWLYVTNGGANSVAVINNIPPVWKGLTPVAGPADQIGMQIGAVRGLIPTGWYPSSVSVSADGKMLYVTDTKSVPGPNPEGCRNTLSIARGSLDECYGQNEYILQLNKGGFETIPTPGADELKSLTKQVAENDHYVSDAQRAANEKMMAFLRQHIKHVIYIIKENRTYDQVLGDLPEGNGDPKLAVLGKAITPNHHQIAQQFVDLDNFYCSAEVSGDGWNWSTAARASEIVENEVPINYAGRGLTYDFEGEDRNINVGIAGAKARHADNPETPDDKNLLPGTNDVDAPDGPGGQAGTGYLWNAALRAHLTLRNYGFFLEGNRYSGKPGKPGLIPVIREPYKTKTRVAFPDKAALMKVTDPYFRGFDLKLPDYWRFNEWNREFQADVKSGKMPNLELVRLMRDHTGDFAEAIDGTGTVEAEVSDNDYAVGKLVEAVAHSPFANSTIVITVEDDAQNGPDHVDAHRSPALVAGAYVKQGAVVSTHYTTVNMLRTIEDILGMKPMGINDDVAKPMADMFTTEYKPWTYTATVPQVLYSTQLPVGKPPAGAALMKPRRDAAYWAAKTKGMDFTVEDHIDSAKFNRIMWRGLEGKNVPYPAKRSGRDLRKNRRELLNESLFLERKSTARKRGSDAATIVR
ncbi:MAG TPA: bifunctional YncE family protein/alkaline phosphatase family protein [Candidatus Acidoferrales bacterium]|nr:bifunctional YncE family protein/alkaline phosphatase family protein [Candidatus Acidoferrales bacterium]